jgi:hypothetical protein
MAEGAGAKTLAPERDTDAGPQDGPQNGRFAGEEQLSGL